MRYPGGKTKQLKTLTPILVEALNDRDTYYEPFVGAGSVFMSVAKTIKEPKRFHINELNYPLYCYWESVFKEPEALKEKIEAYVPAVNDFYNWKTLFVEQTWGAINSVELGFRKLAMHQISYSGLGEMAGSPIGGRYQRSKYDVGCRWNPKRLIAEIDKLNSLPHEIEVHNLDFKCFADTFTKGSVGYFDPPYWDAGSQLYLKAFSENQHWQLYRFLKETPSEWVLSYDWNPVVDKLVEDGHLDRSVVQINTIEGKRDVNRVGTEPLISSMWRDK